MQETFRCPECGAEFPTQQALQDHVNSDHVGTETDAPEQQEDPGSSSEYPSDETLEEEPAERR